MVPWDTHTLPDVPRLGTGTAGLNGVLTKKGVQNGGKRGGTGESLGSGSNQLGGSTVERSWQLPPILFIAKLNMVLWLKVSLQRIPGQSVVAK